MESGIAAPDHVFFWFFGGISVASGLAAVLLTEYAWAALSLWICSMSVGALFLELGAEHLAVLQWILSTLIGISFGFYSALFRSAKKPKSIWLILATFLVGAAFVSVFWVAANSVTMPGLGSLDGALTGAARTVDLKELAGALISEHWLSLEVLALTLFLLVIGVGVVTRTEAEDR